jgi:hypothetical protein
VNEDGSARGPSTAVDLAGESGEERVGAARRRGLRSRVTPFVVFAAAFVFLIGAAVAVGLAQFRSGSAAPWTSIGCSAAAVLLSAVAIFMPRR